MAGWSRGHALGIPTPAALGDAFGAGATRYYQVYYRDPVVLGACPATSTFNISQGLSIAWGF